MFKSVSATLSFVMVFSAVYSGILPVLEITVDPTTGSRQISVTGEIETAYAASTSQKYPTSGTTAAESPWSDNDWNTPTNIYSDDGSTANITAPQYDSPDQSYVLKASGFDFSSIPDGSTINGITVRVNAWYASGQGSGSIDLCQLLNTSGAKVGTNNCSTPTALTTTDTTVITFGGTSDTWGNSLTTSWLKDPDFGVALGVAATAANADVYIDYVSIDVDYTEPVFSAPSWNAADWTLYDTIVIDATQVDATLTDFPVYVDLSDLSATFWSTTPSASSTVGTDIRVTNVSNEELPRELVFASSTLETGELHFKADSISASTDTVFKIWYNGTTTGDYDTDATYGAENVWSNDYIAVYHMQEDPSGGAGAVLDSTSNSLDGTGGSNMVSGDLVSGKLGGSAYNFDNNSNSYVNIGSDTLLDNLGDTNGSTICTWYEHDTLPTGYPALVDKSNGGTGGTIFFLTTGLIAYQTRDADYISPSFTPSGNWEYLCGTWDGADGNAGIDIYADATNLGGSGATGSTVDDSSYNMYFGNDILGNWPIDGRMDELRISSTTRTAAWISAEYVNQSTTTDFYSVTPHQSASTWNGTDWSNYIAITIASTSVDATLTNFPVFVDLSTLGATFWAGIAHSGYDIRVTDASDTELPREVVFANTSTDTGELHFKATTLSSSTDNVFRIYYNGTTTADYATDATYGAENVWSNDYIGVYHFQEMGNNNTRGFIDSTSNGAHGTGNSMATSTRPDGQLGGSLAFDGASDYIQLTGNGVKNVDDFTVSLWANSDWPDDNNVRHIMLWQGDVAGNCGGAEDEWNLNYGDCTAAGFGIRAYMEGTSNDLAPLADATYVTDQLGTWTYIANTMDNMTSNMDGDIHVNAGIYDTVAAAGNAADYTNWNTAMRVGRPGTNERYYDGHLDELRISSTSRSAFWIDTEYDNQLAPTMFYATSSGTYSPPNVWNGTDWSNYIAITIASTSVDATLTNFPVFVDLSTLGATFWAGIAHSGYDIRVTDTSDNELPREVVFANTSTDTGELHFKATTLSSSTDNVFRIYYNGTTTADYATDATYGAENVWTNDYVAVYHLHEDPGTAGVGGILDSTQYSHDGTDSGSMDSTDSVAGNLGGNAISFDGNDDVLTMATSSVMEGLANISFSSWFYPTSSPEASGSRVISKSNGGTGDDYAMTWSDSGNRRIRCRVTTTGETNIDSTLGISLNNWHMGYCEYDGSNVSVDVDDGSYTGSNAATSALNDSNAVLTIGAHESSPSNREFNGYIDEVRIASTTRTAAWIGVEYLNQSAPTTFYATSSGTYSPPAGSSGITISGTLYDTNGSAITTGKTIVAAVGTSTPSRHSATSDGSGNFSIEGIATSSISSWTARSASVADGWTGVTYGNGRFVAGGWWDAVGNKVMYSDDGLTWTSGTNAGGGGVSKIAYGNGRFVAVKLDGTNRIIYSDDGIDWTSVAAPENNTWRDITYGNGRFVAVSQDGTSRVMYSDDGVNWNLASSSAQNSWYSVTYGEGRFVAVGYYSVSTNIIMYSDDGINWTNGTAFASSALYAVTHGNGQFVAVGGDTNQIVYSDDGASWTTATTPEANNWRGLTYGNGQFVAVACGIGSSCNTTAGGSRVMYSSDAVNWTLASSSEANSWNDIAYGDGKFVAVSDNGTNRVMTADAGFGDATPITLFVDGDAVDATTLTYGPPTGTVTLTGINLHQNTVRFEHSSTSGDFILYDGRFEDFYDSADDADILFTATSSATSTFNANVEVDTNTTLYPRAEMRFLDDLTLNGDIAHERGEIVFSSSSSQTITTTNATTTFYTFTATSSAARTLTFTAGDEYVFLATSTITGTASNLTSLRSTSATNEYFFRPHATFTVDYLDVKDSHNISATTTSILCDTNCTNSGNNSGWSLPAAAGSSGITISGTLYDTNGSAITTGKTIVAAVGTSTPSRHSATSDGSGNFSIEGIATSTIGSWATSSVAGDDDSWEGVTYGNGRFVAVADTTYDGTDPVMYSDDGVSWTAVSAAGNNDAWYDVTYGNGLFVAVADCSVSGDCVMTSPDGVNWTVRTAPTDNWFGVTYGNGRFVAVGYAGASEEAIMYSDDGINWTAATAPNTDDAWWKVTYGNGTFVAIGDASGTGDPVMSSPDGINWTSHSAAGDNDIWSDVTYGNGRFVAVADVSVSGDTPVMYSSDGSTWTPVSVFGDDDGWSSVTYGNGRFVMVDVASFGPNSAYSEDGGETWTYVSGNGYALGTAITFGDGTFVSVEYEGGLGIGSAGYIDAGLGPDTPITLFIDGDAVDATTFLMGVSNTDVAGVPLRQNTVTAHNANTVAASSTTQLSETVFYDSTDDADILYTYATTSKTVTINGSFTAGQGTTIAPYTLAITGATTTITGTFDHAYGTTTMSSGNQTLVTTATTTFYQFQAEETSARTLTFSAGEEYVFLATSSISGAASNLTSLRSTSATNEYFFRPHATFTVDYLDVKDSHNISATTTSILCDTNCTDSGNNSGWSLPAAPDASAITLVATSTVDSASFNYCTPTIPATAAAGDFMVVFAQRVRQSNTDTWDNDGGGGLGWRQLVTNTESAGRDQTTAIYYKRHTGAETNPTFTVGTVSDSISCSMAVYRNVDPVSPFDVAYNNSNHYGSGINDGAPDDAPDITTVTDGAMVLTMHAGTDDDITAGGAPSGYTLISSLVPGTTYFDRQAFLAQKLVSTAGTETIGGWTHTYGANESEYQLYTVALRPAQSYDKVMITGTLFESDGMTPITTSKTIKVAVGTSTPSVHSTTTSASGSFFVEGIATSTVGSWTLASSTDDTQAHYDIAYGNGVFVANKAGGSGRIIYSTDRGETWNSSNITSTLYYGVTYGNGTFVSVGVDSYAISYDGINWATGATPSGTWVDVTYGNGRFVAIGGSTCTTNCLMYSDDGSNWTVVSVQTADYYELTYGNGLFVAVSDDGANRMITSSDGITWTNRSVLGNDDDWEDVAYGNGRFVAVANCGASGGDCVAYSSDGITWATSTGLSEGYGTWRGIEYANGQFIALASVGTPFIMTSPDGETWTGGTVPSDNDWDDLVYGDGRLVAYGKAGTSRFMYADAGFGENTPITVWVDGDTVDATTITYGVNGTTSQSITGVDLYQSTVRLEHSSTSGSIDLSDADFYDREDDTDILVTATTSTSTIYGDLKIESNTTLYAPQNLVLTSPTTTISGTFEHERGEVQVAGGNHRFVTTATTTFYNFTAATTSARTLTFTAGQEYVFLATSSISGATGELTSLRSSNDTFEYYIKPHSDFSPDYLDVKDTHNISATTTPIVCTDTCINSGNNEGWTLASAQTAWNATDWTLYDTITIDAANIDSTLTDFPVYVDLADLSSQFWSTTDSSATYVGTDIRVTTDDGSPVELPRELVAASSTDQTGELHFKANSISSSVDTVFRIYYNGTTTGDYAFDDTYGAANVWTNDYVGVWHMDETLDDSTGQYGETNNGTVATTTNAQMGYARYFDGADYIQTTYGDMDNLDDLTISLWVSPDTTNASAGHIVWAGASTGNGGGAEPELHIGHITNDTLEFYGDAPSTDSVSMNSTTTVVADTTYYVAATFENMNSSAIGLAYINGVLDDSDTGTALDDGYDTAMRFGRPGADERYYIGMSDEIRVSSTTRSAAWISAEYVNQSTTTDFYTAAEGGVVVDVTLGEHTVGQVDNNFSFANKTNESFFNFKLTPDSSVTVDSVVFKLTNIADVTDSDFTNLELWIDENNDGVYDSPGDTQVGGAGALVISDNEGTITFSSDFSLTGAEDLMLIGDTVSIDRGMRMTVRLLPNDIVITGSDTIGGVESVVHRRGGSSAGGGASAQIGGAAPAGDGDVGGGGQSGGGAIDTNTGGDTIGPATDEFNWPTAESGSWNNAARAYDANDGTYATTTGSNTNDFDTFAHGVPGTDTIQGIEVKLEVSGTTAAGNIGVELSWNNGSNFTTTGYTTGTVTDTDSVITLGGPSDTWGRGAGVWVPDNFSDANFVIRVTGNPSSNELRIDGIQVKVYHQAGGGGAGGGGAI